MSREIKGRLTKVARGLGLLVVGLGVAASVHSAIVRSPQPPVSAPEAAELSAAEQDLIAKHLAGAVRLRTISQAGQPTATAELTALHAYLAQTFPALHAALKVEKVNGLSLLYTWPGQDPSARPYLLLAHQDVVPADESSGSRWTHPPFSGDIADGYIWGRGTLDDKGNVLAILESVERLVRAGYKPRRTIYLAMGHDEEVAGSGARALAELLAQRGVHLDYVLDEGMIIADGMVPGARQPVALIGMAEKGYLSLELTTHAAGGHSSMPTPHTAIGVLSRAVRRVEDQPFSPALRPPASQLMEYVGPELHGPLRWVFTNLWLLRPAVTWQLGQTPSGSALLRTTTAVTIFEGGTKDNVLPQSARAVINFRLLPGDSAADVEARVRRVIDDTQVTIRPLPDSAAEASPVASDKSASFQTLTRTIRSVFPDVLVAPSLMIGQTDSRQFRSVADSTYRFSAVLYNEQDLERLHGTDERISIAAYASSVRFFEQLVRSSDREP